MNETYGMNPELARAVMDDIKNLKVQLTNEMATAGNEINQKVAAAFPGTQSDSMKVYVNSLTNALDELYRYIDGNESSFAKVFEGTIASYVKSDENVASSYSITE